MTKMTDEDTQRRKASLWDRFCNGVGWLSDEYQRRLPPFLEKYRMRTGFGCLSLKLSCKIVAILWMGGSALAVLTCVALDFEHAFDQDEVLRHCFLLFVSVPANAILLYSVQLGNPRLIHVWMCVFLGMLVYQLHLLTTDTVMKNDMYFGVVVLNIVMLFYSISIVFSHLIELHEKDERRNTVGHDTLTVVRIVNVKKTVPGTSAVNDFAPPAYDELNNTPAVNASDHVGPPPYTAVLPENESQMEVMAEDGHALKA